jgi:uncharacterized protein DUF1707
MPGGVTGVASKSGGDVPSEFPSAEEPPDPAARSQMRASDADRDRVMDILRAATAEGRLTVDELEERLEAALTARTFGELGELTADLPVEPVEPVELDLPGPAVMASAEDVLRIDQRSGSFQRGGRWVVPRRLELRPSWCDVLLDFTEAMITNDTLLIDIRMRGGSLILVTGPGMLVDDNGLTVRYTDVKIDPAPWPVGPVVLRIRLSGRMRYGWIETRWAQQTAG